MNKLNDVSVNCLLPPSIKDDENVKALASAMTTELLAIASELDLIRILANIDTLPVEVLDLLAWQYHVDFYDVTYDRAKKKALLYQAIAWHRRKGTVSVVKEIVTAVHSNAQIIENWDYGGEPYHFKVIVDGAQIEDAATLNTLTRAIESVKNVRSWLDNIEYTRGTATTLYIGGAVYIHKEVLIA